MFEVIILTNTNTLCDTAFAERLAAASAEKQREIHRLIAKQDKRNRFLGGVLARNELSRVTGIDKHALQFATNENGKPYLANMPHVHYNLSHSGEYVAFALSDEPVGIDVEVIRPINKNIAKRFFTQNERDHISNCPYRFFEVWTKKESHIKREGSTLSKLPSFSALDADERNTLFYHSIFNNGSAICHACSTKKVPPTVKAIDASTYLQQQNNLHPNAGYKDFIHKHKTSQDRT